MCMYMLGYIHNIKNPFKNGKMYVYRIDTGLCKKALSCKKRYFKNTWNKGKLQNRCRARPRWAKGKIGMGL